MKMRSYRLQGKSEEPNLFEKNENTASLTAWACLVYSFVPYLGILFVPFAFFAGVFGYAVSYRRPRLGGRNLGIICAALSFVVLVIQILLWRLLYIIPELGRNV